MNKVYLIFIVFAVSLFTFFTCESEKKVNLTQICFGRSLPQPVEKVSLRDFEKIKQFDGKFVEMEGFFRYRFEDVALYPSYRADPTEAMWVDIIVPDTISNNLVQQLDEKRITIIGRVNLKNKGNFNGYMGTLDSAFCIRIK